MKKIMVMVMAAWFWSFGALAAISQELKDEYNEAYLSMIGAAGCVESYLDHSTDFSFLKTCGWQLAYHDLADKKFKAHFMVAEKETASGTKIYLVIFRGTAELRDWGINLKAGHCAFGGKTLSEMENLAAVPYRKDRPAVHKGFSQYVGKVLKAFVLLEDGRTFKGLFADVQLNQRSRLFLIGHSLGGAVAALLGQRLYDLGLPSERMQIITFGAPAIGNKAFADELGGRVNLLRHTTTADPVPLSVQTVFHDYKHFGRVRQYDVDVRISDNQHSSSLYLDNAFLGYYGVRGKVEGILGRPLRKAFQTAGGVPVVGVQVTLGAEAVRYAYMQELREFLLDQYAGCFPCYILGQGPGKIQGHQFLADCEINGRQDRQDKAWYIEVTQKLYNGRNALLSLATYSKRVASGSGNVKTLAENWLEARRDLQKLLPFIKDGSKLNLLE